MRSWDKPGGRPAYCPGGIRREEGASAIQALAWNRRTRRPGIPAPECAGWREFLKRQKPREAEYRSWARGRTVP